VGGDVCVRVCVCVCVCVYVYVCLPLWGDFRATSNCIMYGFRVGFGMQVLVKAEGSNFGFWGSGFRI